MAQVVEADRGGHDEQEGADGGEDGERLGEILRTLHFRDEGGEEDLRDPEERDIEDGVQAVDPCGSWQGEGVGSHGAVGGVVPVVAI